METLFPQKRVSVSMIYDDTGYAKTGSTNSLGQSITKGLRQHLAPYPSGTRAQVKVISTSFVRRVALLREMITPASAASKFRVMVYRVACA